MPHLPDLPPGATGTTSSEVQSVLAAVGAMETISVSALAVNAPELTDPQLRVLGLLAERGCCTPDSLADHLGCGPDVAARVSAELVGRELAERAPAGFLRLAEAGRAALAAVRRRREDLLAAVLNRADCTVPELVEALHALADAAGEVGVGAADGAAGSTRPHLAVLPHCGDEYAALDPILADFLAAPQGSRNREQSRRQLITGLLPVVEHLARRHVYRGEPLADLVQAGAVGLIQAIDRFDPERGVTLLGYAIPTIDGAIHHHLRDHGRAIRLSRRHTDLRPRYYQAIAELSQAYGRAPRPSEVAAHLGLDREHVLGFLRAEHEAYNIEDLDRPLPGDVRTTLAELIAEPVDAVQQATDHHALHTVLAGLPARERALIQLRFFTGLTQTEIATRIGVSQMHVSRLLARTLATLRERLSR